MKIPGCGFIHIPDDFLFCQHHVTCGRVMKQTAHICLRCLKSVSDLTQFLILQFQFNMIHIEFCDKIPYVIICQFLRMLIKSGQNLFCLFSQRSEIRCFLFFRKVFFRHIIPPLVLECYTKSPLVLYNTTVFFLLLQVGLENPAKIPFHSILALRQISIFSMENWYYTAP